MRHNYYKFEYTKSDNLAPMIHIIIYLQLGQMEYSKICLLEQKHLLLC